jgi:hypothetical protein
VSSTEGYPNQSPISQQLIGSKKRLGTFASRRSLCIPSQQNQKSKAASVGGLFHLPQKVLDHRERRDKQQAVDRAPSYGAGYTVCGRLFRSLKR